MKYRAIVHFKKNEKGSCLSAQVRPNGITSIIRGITANLVPGQKNFSSAPGLRAGLFSDLSAGDTCPFGILAFVELRLPPTDKSQRDGGLPAVAAEKPFCPCSLSCYVRQTIPSLTKNHP